MSQTNESATVSKSFHFCPAIRTRQTGLCYRAVLLGRSSSSTLLHCDLTRQSWFQSRRVCCLLALCNDATSIGIRNLCMGEGRESRGVAWRVQCSAVQPRLPSFCSGRTCCSVASFARPLSLTHTHTATDETKPVYCMRPRLGYLGWLSVFLLLLSSKF